MWRLVHLDDTQLIYLLAYTRMYNSALRSVPDYLVLHASANEAIFRMHSNLQRISKACDNWAHKCIV